MQVRCGFAVVALLAALLLTPLFAQQQAQSKVSGVFSNLKAGQALNVKETGERYLLTVIDGDSKLPQPHTILEVGSDFVVVKDFTGLNETRIPITSVKAVVHFKGFDRK
ncbi:hypothetical protein Spb1_22130 [Planctopirus ephydatiae]|uniref:Uncharacterized protein n=1 Tax=Planctopirus ephydatiae TaxID=2528019 RepID=A0A518GP25_9PLAN|nr:hypothetical protein [Planctopirus ephydatiae]QDV30284.1 hypothetical protein Spb1_22130 [Planctopirus ephydatiae]